LTIERSKEPSIKEEQITMRQMVEEAIEFGNKGLGWMLWSGDQS